MAILSQQKQSQNTDFPNIRPSLDLRFALAKKLDPRITFTRGSTGTYFGPDGLMRTAGVNEPRFDHNPITGQSLGLLVEESRSNLITYSDDFNNAIWTKQGSSISSNTTATTAPDGSNNADKLIDTAVNGVHYAYQSISFTTSTTYTFSIYAKKAELQYLWMTLPSTAFGSNKYRVFNLNNGDGSVGNSTSYSSTNVGNGWWRLIITDTATSSSSGQVQIVLRNQQSGGSSYLGDGTSGIYIWGAQLEAGAFPTSYIPTTNATVTRSADLASMTGTNFSSWYNQNEGTIMVDCANPTLSIVPVAISDGTTSNRFQLETGTNTRGVRVVFNGITQTSTLSYTYYTKQKMIMSYSSSAINFANAGVFVTSIKPQGIPVVNTLRIGANVSNSGQNNLPISRLIYYPIRITDQQMRNLTS